MPRSRASLPAVTMVMLLAAASAQAQEAPETVTAPAQAETEAAPEAPADAGGEDAGAEAETPAAAPDAASNEELERRIDVLAGEIEKLRIGEAANRAEESVYGLGPAASKIYRVNEGLSIGGYGEVEYRNYQTGDRTDLLDFHRAIFYIGYKFDDTFVFNSEIEIEHVDEIFLEFAYLDYLRSDAFNLRGGLVLVPMGILNELHEPTTYLGSLRPETEQKIIPTTWREIGGGVFGSAGSLSYKLYAINGLNAAGFSSGDGVRGGRTKGSRAVAEDFAGVARLDYTGLPGLTVGGSAYFGESDQNSLTTAQGGDFNVPTFLYEAHADWAWRGFSLRGVFARAQLRNADLLTDALSAAAGSPVAPIGDAMQGYYLTAGYDVLASVETKQSLVPFVRYERVDTQFDVADRFNASDANDRTLLTFGASYLPIPQIVLKADYQDITTQAERLDPARKAADQWNVALGYIF